jgi:PKD repeat protein
VQVGEPVLFVASATASAGESISAVSWDLGSGNFGEATGTAATKTFTTPGTYTVRVKATDAFGLSTVSTKTITVAAAPVSSSVTPAATIKALPRLRLVWIKASHGHVKVKLSCKSASCSVSANLTTLERLITGRISSLSASGHGKHTKTVSVASAKLQIAANKTKVFTLKLNTTGQRLLSAFHSIPAKGSFKLTNGKPAKTIHHNIKIH